MRSARRGSPPSARRSGQLRVLADPNVLVAAVISREGVCSRLVLAAATGRYTLIASPQLLAELTAVLE